MNYIQLWSKNHSNGNCTNVVIYIGVVLHYTNVSIGKRHKIIKIWGMDSSRAESKLSSLPCGYTLQEAQAIMTELRNIQHSLSSGEKEKAELMASLSRLRDDLTRLKPLNNDLSPDLSTLSLPQEKFSTASQTDLSGLLVFVCV